MKKGIFICGTGTGIGKTVVSCLLVSALRAKGIDCGVMKPVACAGIDAQKLKFASGVNDTLGLIRPFYSNYPYAPMTAFEKEGIKFNKKKVISAYEELSGWHQFMVVEGAGGLMAPITRKYFISDLALDLGLPVAIVASCALGTINHTLLSIEYARKRKIKIAGIIFNHLSKKNGVCERENQKIIAALSGKPVLGQIPYKPFKNPAKIKFNMETILNG